MFNTVLLGVVEKQLHNEVFPAEMERKLAQLLSEVPTRRRLWRRATVAAGNSVVQVLTEGGWWAEEKPLGICDSRANGKVWCELIVQMNTAALRITWSPGRNLSNSLASPWIAGGVVENLQWVPVSS